MALYQSPEYQTSFESTGLLVQENKFKIEFQDSGHLAFLSKMILAIFDLQLTLILPTSGSDTSYQVLSHLAFPFRRSSSKYIFKVAAILDFQLEQF